MKVLRLFSFFLERIELAHQPCSLLIYSPPQRQEDVQQHGVSQSFPKALQPHDSTALIPARASPGWHEALRRASPSSTPSPRPLREAGPPPPSLWHGLSSASPARRLDEGHFRKRSIGPTSWSMTIARMSPTPGSVLRSGIASVSYTRSRIRASKAPICWFTA